MPGHRSPDELRIDLDPQPGTGFAEARAVAVEVLKPVLDELGMVGYPKTSGGRGVHVFLRITADWDFVAVRRAGIALAREVQRRAPDGDDVMVERGTRSTHLHRLQPERARPHLRRRLLRAAHPDRHCVDSADMGRTGRGRNPDDYTMATVPDLLARRGDPMAGLDSVAQSIEPLLALADADAERGLGDLPYPPTIRRCPANRKGFS